MTQSPVGCLASRACDATQVLRILESLELDANGIQVKNCGCLGAHAATQLRDDYASATQACLCIYCCGVPCGTAKAAGASFAAIMHTMMHVMFAASSTAGSGCQRLPKQLHTAREFACMRASMQPHRIVRVQVSAAGARMQ